MVHLDMIRFIRNQAIVKNFKWQKYRLSLSSHHFLKNVRPSKLFKILLRLVKTFELRSL